MWRGQHLRRRCATEPLGCRGAEGAQGPRLPLLVGHERQGEGHGGGQTAGFVLAALAASARQLGGFQLGHAGAVVADTLAAPLPVPNRALVGVPWGSRGAEEEVGVTAAADDGDAGGLHAALGQPW